MLKVGIRELKSRLSQYIDLVRSGEEVLITEHNVVVAELRKPEIHNQSVRIEDFLKNLESEGKLVRAKRKSSTLSLKRSDSKSKVNQSDWWKIYQGAKDDGI